MTGSMPPFIQRTISDAVQTTLAQFRTGKRDDYGQLLALQVAGQISEADVKSIMEAVTFTQPGVGRQN
jgi:hypothetical protein